jgi:hypothetical protein
LSRRAVKNLATESSSKDHGAIHVPAVSRPSRSEPGIEYYPDLLLGYGVEYLKLIKKIPI